MSRDKHERVAREIQRLTQLYGYGTIGEITLADLLSREYGEPSIELCASHAERWFTMRNTLRSESCVVCAFQPPAPEPPQFWHGKPATVDVSEALSATEAVPEPPDMKIWEPLAGLTPTKGTMAEASTRVPRAVPEGAPPQSVPKCMCTSTYTCIACVIAGKPAAPSGQERARAFWREHQHKYETNAEVLVAFAASENAVLREQLDAEKRECALWIRRNGDKHEELKAAESRLAQIQAILSGDVDSPMEKLRRIDVILSRPSEKCGKWVSRKGACQLSPGHKEDCDPKGVK